MFTSKRWLSAVLSILVLVGLFSTGATPANATEEKTAEKGKPAPKIQMAILLDTSGSMRGLINQARSQLWKVVNEFALAKRGDQRPLLEVALYEYGHASLGAKAGFMRQISPLTDDLDKISEELFKLQVGGSAEYCGMAIDKATKELKWSESGRDLKCIFIAGNEPFTQGPVDFREACKSSANKGVTVSTIYCGPNADGVSTMWLEASKLADGSYMSIDQNQQVVAIAAPQDTRLSELSAKINTTYVAYGNAKKRAESAQRQVAQDANAAGASPASSATRAQFKGSRLYSNAGWDLCDACRLGKIKIEDLKDDQLPENLKKMSLAERKSFIEKMIKDRQDIQKQIKDLSDARAKYVAAERKKLAVNEDDTLDAAIVTEVRRQATVKNFSFDK
jgi:hypothetical protein